MLRSEGSELKEMQKDFLFVNRNFKDLNPMLYGCQDCAPSHSFGPSVRTYTIIHYVERGKGKLYKYGREYPVRAGEAFVILPHEVTTYTADADDLADLVAAVEPFSHIIIHTLSPPQRRR